MLVACEKCHRQYDVGDLAAGSKVRCYCGRLCTVSPRKPRDASMAHCSSCGGNLAKEAKVCSFCRSAVTLAERGWGEACPECLARLVRDARFCNSCGVAIRPEALLKTTSTDPCPRCKKPLGVREIPGAAFCECASCGGIWLEEQAFERIVRDREQSAIAAWVLEEGQGGTPSRLEEKVQYLACPRCQGMMNRKNFAGLSGVIIDWCKGHGYWFDTFELERIADFIGKGGMDKARARQLEDEKQSLARTRERATHVRTHGASGALANPFMEPRSPPAFAALLAALIARMFRRG